MFKFYNYLNKIDIVYRLILSLLLVVGIITIVAYEVFKPSDKSLLSEDNWCVDKIYYKQKLIGPKSLMAFYIKYSNGEIPCYENADFRKNGNLILPGINSTIISGTWRLDDNNKVQIKVDTLQDIFQGIYDMEVSLNTLRLTSKTTIIYSHKDKTSPPNLF